MDDQAKVNKLLNELGAAKPGQTQAKAQPTLEDLNTAKTIMCKKCAGVVWGNGFILKQTSTLSLIGEQNVAVPAVYCVGCGAPNMESIPCTI